MKDIQNGQALREQLIEFPKGTHDDMVDMVVYAVRLLLVEGVGQDSDGFDESGSYHEKRSMDDEDEEDWSDDDYVV